MRDFLALFGIDTGCFFGHIGEWEPPKEEAWTRNRPSGGSQTFYKTVQFRTCTVCKAVEKRIVSNGITY